MGLLFSDTSYILPVIYVDIHTCHICRTCDIYIIPVKDIIPVTLITPVKDIIPVSVTLITPVKDIIPVRHHTCDSYHTCKTHHTCEVTATRASFLR